MSFAALVAVLAITSASEVMREVERADPVAARFELTATLTSDIVSNAIAFTVQDDSGYAVLIDWRKTKEPLVAGDRVRVAGRICTVNDVGCCALVDRVAFLAHGAVPPPVEATVDQIYSGRLTAARVRVRGWVVDAFRDEANPEFTFLVLRTEGGTLYLPSIILTDEIIATLVGAEVEVTGTCSSYRNHGPRAKLGYEINIDRADDIRVLKPVPTDPFDVPLLEGSVYDVFRLQSRGGERRKTRGEVVAVWQGNRFLLRTPTGETPTVLLAGESAPACGMFVEAVGLPETDFYNHNLSRAVWRETAPLAVSNPPPECVSADYLLTDGEGRRAFKVEYHGRVVRFEGVVQNRPHRVHGDGIFHLLSGESLVPVDASSVPEVWGEFEVGAKVEVTGICLMETKNWFPQAPFPHVQGVSVILRSRADLVVRARPPWWTPARLLAVIGSLVLVLLVILAWNAVLRRLIDRKGRQLFKAQIAKAESELRIEERTRLAAELHDSISQNLTGVALEVNATDRLVESDLPAARRHLTRAMQTLKSCREELRDCLWDLRSNALGELRMDDAIRRTLAPQVGEAELVVRFAVSRRKLTDNTTHTILRIVRELAVNAVRHGGATKIWIAGSEERGNVLFSVRDNGTGFDPNVAPGVREGHFGLQGIRERVREFQGELKLESERGKGVKAMVRLEGVHGKD